MNESQKSKLKPFKILELVLFALSKLSTSACIMLGLIIGLIFWFSIVTMEGIENYANPWALGIAIALWASAILLIIKIKLKSGHVSNEHIKYWAISLVMSTLTFGLYQAFPSSLFVNDDLLKLFETLIPMLANFLLVAASFLPLIVAIEDNARIKKNSASLINHNL